VPVLIHAQVSSTVQGGVAEGGPMRAQSPAMGQSYSLGFASEVPRTNYLLGGITVGSAYDTNVTSSGTEAVSSASYYVTPKISILQTRGRIGWDLSYKPGFTLYQRVSAKNQADQVFDGSVQYRLSPHVTLSASDRFSRTSNFFNQAPQDPASGITPGPFDVSIVTPVADRIANAAVAGFNYQFRPDAMFGASGMISQLHYPNLSEVPGLYNSDEYMGQGFYTHRFVGRHYLGVSYEFQKLMAQPIGTATKAHTGLLFYTLMQSSISVSVFGGPQYSDSGGGALLPIRVWTPVIGASVNWHGGHTSFGLTVSRQVHAGYGFSGATRYSVAGAAVRRQLTQHLTAGVTAQYSNSQVLNPVPGSSTGGHGISGTVSFSRPIGEHVGMGLGYTRLHQSYSHIPILVNTPDRDRVWIALSYQFQRPLGR
jgi:hypothetical protein